MRAIPTKENYDGFVRELVGELSKRHPDTCFYAYGSYTDGNCNYGRSDIDGGLISNSRIVTPKEELLDIASILARALGNNRVKTQFNLLDRETCKEGRFLAYTLDYTAWIRKVGKVLSGPNYLGEMNGLDFKSGTLHNAAFNLRKARNNLLYSFDTINTDSNRFRERTEKVLETLAKLPKFLIWLRGGEVIVPRVRGREELKRMLGDVDLSFIEELEVLLRRPARFYSEIEDTDRALSLMVKGVTTMEQIIQSYVNRFPEASARELKK